MSKNQTIHIGTSGWHYQHWRGLFYPQDILNSKLLEFYAHHFDTAEINNTFYQLPSEKTLAHWRDTVPDDFIFPLKASQYITHRKKLKDGDITLPKFLDRSKILGAKLGPILFQLPPHWSANPERLRNFLQHLPDDNKYAFEFRDPSWFIKEVTELLEDKRASFCMYHLAGQESPHTLTSDMVYIRLHGPGDAYQGSYDDDTLNRWAGEIKEWANNGREIYCYFDNDEAGYAVHDAMRLKAMIGYD